MNNDKPLGTMNVREAYERAITTNESIVAIGKARTQELINDKAVTKEEMATRFASMELDFAWVVEMNKQIAQRYEEFMACLPTSKEMKSLMDSIQVGGESYVEHSDEGYQEEYGYPLADVPERLAKLRKFTSALITLEKNEYMKKAPRYDDIMIEEQEPQA